MTTDEILAKFHGVRRVGPDEWAALCPTHADRKPSLGFRTTPEKMLLTCRAGCQTEDVLAAVGLSFRDLYFNSNEPGAARLQLQDFAAAKGFPVSFLLEHGVVQNGAGLCITYRERDGSLSQRQRLRTAIAATDGSLWLGPKGVAVSPYGRWRLDDAVKQGVLLLVEGETDPLTAWLHNIPCLGIPGADMLKVLSAEDLIGIDTLYVLREPDTGGENFVANTADRLERLGWRGRAAAVTLPVKDLHELHLSAGERFAEEFAKAQSSATPLDEAVRRREEVTASALASATGPWDRAVSAANLLARGPVDVQWLNHPFFAPGTITEVFAPRGTGKSLIAMARLLGLALAGLQCLYIDRDNPPTVVRKRLLGFQADRAATLEVMTREDAPSLTDAAAWASYPFGRYVAIVVDSLDAFMEGAGEKDSARTSRALAPLLDIARREQGPAVLVLGNVVKSGTNGRGAGVIEDRADYSFEARDATGFTPTGRKPWWEELPSADRAEWATRATRRTGRDRRDRIRVAFISTKCRSDDDPDPFVVE